MSEEYKYSLWLLLCVTVVIIAAVLNGHDLLSGLSEVIRAFGAAFNIAIAGTAGAVALAPWAAGSTSVGIALGGTGVAVVVVCRLVREAKKNVLASIVPFLALFTGGVVDLAKELYGDDKLGAIFYSIMLGAFPVLGAVLVERRSLWCKVLGVIAYFVPPLGFVLLLLYQRPSMAIEELLRQQPTLTFVTLGILVFVSSIGIGLSLRTKRV